MPKRYSSSVVCIHLLKMETTSVGVAVNDTHASNVALAPGVSASMSAASTKLLVPLSDTQLPNLQALLHAAPDNVAVLLLTDASDAVVPAPSSKEYAATALVCTLATVTTTPVDVVVFPAASRATAVSVWLPLVAVVVSHDSE